MRRSFCLPAIGADGLRRSGARRGVGCSRQSPETLGVLRRTGRQGSEGESGGAARLGLRASRDSPGVSRADGFPRSGSARSEAGGLDRDGGGASVESGEGDGCVMVVAAVLMVMGVMAVLWLRGGGDCYDDGVVAVAGAAAIVLLMLP